MGDLLAPTMIILVGLVSAAIRQRSDQSADLVGLGQFPAFLDTSKTPADFFQCVKVAVLSGDSGELAG
jgi:hypothetical protein